MVADYLHLLGVVLSICFVAYELIALRHGIQNAMEITQEDWSAGPLTFIVRLQVFFLEWMWLSWVFSDLLKRSYKVPNYPIKTGMMCFGGIAGYYGFLATDNLMAGIGIGQCAALSLGAGAVMALRRNATYLSYQKQQAEMSFT